MRHFNNLRIRNKTILSYALVLVLAAGLGLFVILRLQLIDTQLYNVEQNVLAFPQLAAMKGAANRLDALAGQMILADPSGRAAIVGEQDAARKTYATQWSGYAPTTDPGRETADAQTFNAAFAHVSADANQIMQDVNGGDVIAAKSVLLGNMNGDILGFLGTMHDDLDYQSDQAAQFAATANAAATSSRLGIFVVLGIMLVLIVALSWLTVRAIATPVAGMTETMRRLANRDTNVVVPGIGRRDEIGAMAVAVQVFKDNAIERVRLEAEATEFQKNLDRKLQETEAAFEAAGQAQKAVVEGLKRGLADLAAGNLTARLSLAVSREYESLKSDFNSAMESLQNTMASVASNTLGVKAGAAEITRASDDLSRRTEQQAASLEETAAALDQITATVTKTAEGARNAREVVSAARQDAEESGKVVSETVTAMSSIETSSREIANIIGVIDEIAFQTNLLALNAGVEAARAGEAGRGFAVVATEVRALAQRSADAAKEIKMLISTSSTQVESGVKLVGDTGRALSRIVEQVSRLNVLVMDIAASAQEQATGLSQVNNAINAMDQTTQQNAAMVEQSTAASHSLAGEAEKLMRLMERFSIGDVEESQAPAVHSPGRKHAEPGRSSGQPKSAHQFARAAAF